MPQSSNPSQPDIAYAGELPTPATRTPPVIAMLAAIRGADNLGLAVYPNGSGKLISAHGERHAVEDIKVGAAVTGILGRPLSQIHSASAFSTFDLNADQVGRLLPVFAHEPDRIFTVQHAHDAEGTRAVIAQLQSSRQRA